eukprot:scaffold345_cov134-Cylindrotheca_fusiformis.AAC.75
MVDHPNNHAQTSCTAKEYDLRTLLCMLAMACPALGFSEPPVLSKSQAPPLESRLANINDERSTYPDDAEMIPSPSRRNVLENVLQVSSIAMLPCSAALAESSVDPVVPSPPFTADVSWPLGKVAFSLLPLAGTSSRRATVEECVIPETIWTHDQIQGVVNVNVPVRQTVIRLKGGGLWVHNPVAPTPQLLQMMKNLEAKYGPVRHIVLGTVALEHKATFGPFCNNFPRATVWIQPGQWAFPVDLSIDYLGVNQRGPRFRELPVPGKEVSKMYRTRANSYPPPEWQDEINYEVLGPFSFKAVGGFSETAFYHKQTRSLLVTDTVVSVTATPPPIIQEDPRALLFHARDNITEVLEDTQSNREKGWRRMVQFGLVFFPSQIEVTSSPEQALKEAKEIDPRMANLGDGAVPLRLYPWSWKGNADARNFERISQNGKLFCPPILTKLILDREPEATLEWVNRVSKRFSTLERIIPCHLNNNVKASASDFSGAFDVLRSSPGKIRQQRPLAEDLALLQDASDVLTRLGIVEASRVCDGEPARDIDLGRRFSKG